MRKASTYKSAEGALVQEYVTISLENNRSNHMQIILSTRNPTKVEQIRELFIGNSIVVLNLSDVNILGQADEDGTSLAENAMKKALFAYEHSGESCWTMADDTGIFIDALNGEPGMYAARWAGEHKTTEEILSYALTRLVGENNRTAQFKTVVAVVSPTGAQYFFEGEVRGSMLETPRVAPQLKMPYSSLFVPDGYEKSWAEMTTEQENMISHRGKAFRKVLEFLKIQNT